MKAGLTRRTAILSAAAVLIAAKAPSRRPLRVMFVCQKGTVKSPIGRELLRREAALRQLSVLARSRGIEPKEGASPTTSAALVRDGIAVKRDPLRALSRKDMAWADVVVFFDPLPQPLHLAGKDLRDWRDTPSVNQDYNAAISAITARIAVLLDELAKRG
jgi:protein-tyrosine-phosphatase